jgi:tRNA nucleotidyltransferase (CCA-adding enzyme)
MEYTIPKEVVHAVETLQKGGFDAYLVGGCVRDMLLNKTPKDWDITTNANPEQIQGLFDDTFYENDFGTVGVKYENAEDEAVKVIEITPYRKEGTYSDLRRPDTVEFGVSLEEDLARRDFTVNAIAHNISNGQFVDPYNGQKDIAEKTLRAGLTGKYFKRAYSR